ncbi:MAG: hypothetical protein ACK4WD_08020 [Flavobacteriales bacterium]|jgi:hypothetical protein
MSLRPKFIGSMFLVVSLVVFSTGCEQPASTNITNNPTDGNNVSSTGTVKLDGQIISIPSPNQLAILVRQSNVPFRPEKLHDLKKTDFYLSEQKKALNLGVYGADLAYIANFDKGQLANDYFDAVGKVAGELEILDHIDGKLVSRLSNNISNRDSVLRLSGQFFHSADRYLKNNKRTDLAGLVLLGGWVESIHFASEAAKTNEDVKRRIAEQKHACASLTNLIMKINDPSLDSLLDQLIELNSIYSELSSNYTYSKPITDEKEKTTYITSKSSVNMDQKQLEAVSNRIEAIRSIIIQ